MRHGLQEAVGGGTQPALSHGGAVVHEDNQSRRCAMRANALIGNELAVERDLHELERPGGLSWGHYQSHMARAVGCLYDAHRGGAHAAVGLGQRYIGGVRTCGRYERDRERGEFR
jgi:hypothetical protein